MKKKSIITMLSLCLGLGMATTSCEDMLTSDSSRHSYDVAQDTLYSYWGILQSLQNIGERYVILGECRGDLIDGSEFTTDSVNAMLSFGLNGDVENIKDGANRYLKVSDYYHIINSCNAYLAQVDTLKEKANGDKYMTREWAQVEAIRAWTYMQLVINYGEVPFYMEPQLTTSDINNFDASKAENRVNASNLWQKLESRMIQAYRIERAEGYPQYNSYGYNAFLCHSSKTMFPTAVVLADLYLMGNQYEKAASYYYDFFRWSDYGGTLPTNYYSYAYIPQGEHTPEGTWSGYPWDTSAEEEKRTKKQPYESLTAIPSSTNALWGTVQRGVNDLFGFAATIRQNTVDTVTTASINLTQEWDHRQLAPSAGYDALRLSQKFEVYTNHIEGSGNNKQANLDKADIKIFVIENVGDARGVEGKFGMGYISQYGSGDYYIGETQTARYIMKQNPSGRFSTTYPMVYRKSMVWLRFAEALNRAGYPGYAFAILKNGIAKNSEWFPTKEADFLVKTGRAHFEYNTKYTNAEGVEKDTVIILPQDWKDNDACLITNLEYDSLAYYKNMEAYVTAVMADKHFDTIPEEQKLLHLSFNTIIEAAEFANYQPAATEIVCDYISKEECEKAKSVSWLDFNNTYFNGENNLLVTCAEDTLFKKGDNGIYNGISLVTQESKSKEETITRGIHQKGCGMLKYDEKNSVYNYVDQINLKLKAAGKRELTKNEIYESVNKADVIEAIEDLILDEAALELAFEGNRFFDLMRVANRRSNPGKFMADKIRARGESTSTWVNALESDIRNWYLPLPDGSYRK